MFNKKQLVQAHTSPQAGMMFYDSVESARDDTDLTGYMSAIERAWNVLNLDGILCLDARPVLYLKNYGRPFAARERILLQKLFWNQGVANVLVLADPVSVYIYSGLARPSGDRPNVTDRDKKETALVETLTQADYVMRIQSFFHNLATGHYYETNRDYFSPDQTVDSWLTDNLRDFRNALIKGDKKLETKDAHAFIGRIFFLCYLLDRGIVFVGKTGRNQTGTALLAEVLEEKTPEAQIDYLYELFRGLKYRFNGNMFDQDIEAEKSLIRPFHLKKTILFLGGHDVGSGQRALGFWPYDFKMIPVETISAIYEDFLTTEDRETQRKKGVFYTPRFLAEMLADVAVDEEPKAYSWSFLDPSCGSGIFLVILFNRLANHWLRNRKKVPYITKAKALKRILVRQICGADVSETACRIACFSLYLAYLDFFDPPDIVKHMKRTGEPLPKLLDYGDDPDHPSPDIPVIYRADFLAKETLAGKKFDCVIGNPPWEGRGSKQIALKFIEKVPQLLRTGGTCCLLLPAKILQNQTDAFQARWLSQVTLEKVLQLADYRHLLFQNAKTPAFIARFINKPPRLNQHMVEYTAPKFNRSGLRKGLIIVNPSSRTWIPLIDVISAAQTKTAPLVWKRRAWGTHRDQKLLDLLQYLPRLKENIDMHGELRKRGSERTKRWIAGQGIKPWPKSKEESDRPGKPIIWPPDTRFIETGTWNSDLLLLKYDTINLEERFRKKQYRSDILYSQPLSELFCHPMILISQGFSKITYCDFDVLFQHSLQSIAGPEEDANLLMFLTAYLRSNLARYFLFHTSANWGSERDKVHLTELLRVPFPLPGNEFISPDAEKIVGEFADKFHKLRDDLQDIHSALKTKSKDHSLFDADEAGFGKKWQGERKIRVDRLQKEVEPMIYRYFGLTDQEISLVEDTVRVFIPSSAPNSWRAEKAVTLNPVDNTKVEPYVAQGLKAYADTLSRTLNQWARAEGSDYCLCAEGGIDKETGLAMVTLRLSETEAVYRKKTLSQKLVEVLNSYYKNVSKNNGTMRYERDILVFQGDEIHIVRPNILLNWTRTAALNDAARIYGDIALVGKEPA
ncbi:N-6 DNA methylase [Desulfococcaceae bacterium HSG8]|nr:N-6 DNA methylase [Desulfococcaceae bacterium HSG8]